MACYHPIPALQQGSEPPRLWPPLGTANLALPCSRCLGCKAAKATQWAHRCGHEATQWQHNIFVTLTYDDAHLPSEGHLNAGHLKNFLKRLREQARKSDAKGGGLGPPIERDRTANIRYFACGEYGERNGRPHYHAILFNYGLTDGCRIGGSPGTGRQGKPRPQLYTSDYLTNLWGYGHTSYGHATAAAANYIAQYALKKQGAGDHDADGVYRPAPFLRMSTRPAIGTRWLEKYKDDLKSGYLVAGQHQQPIPRTYREKIKKLWPELAEEIDIRSALHRKNNPSDRNDEARIRASEIIHKRMKEMTEKRNL